MCTTRRFLAVEPQFGSVIHCDCGTLHLTIGVVSLALDRRALRRLHRLLAAALDRLPKQAEPSESVEQSAATVLH